MTTSLPTQLNAQEAQAVATVLAGIRTLALHLHVKVGDLADDLERMPQAEADHTAHCGADGAGTLATLQAEHRISALQMRAANTAAEILSALALLADRATKARAALERQLAAAAAAEAPAEAA